MSGYALSQPYGLVQLPQNKIDGVSPAAGASYSHKFTGIYVTRIVSIVFKLTTDANAANRYVTVEVQGDNGNAFAVSAAAVVVTASTTGQRFCGTIYRGTSEWNTGTDVLFPLTPIFIHGGDVLKINVASIQAGDQLSAIEIVGDRFSTDPTLDNAD